MSKTVVLTGTGRDQVGIVAKLTEALFEVGCNLLDSSMTLLRGEFAIIVMVELPGQETQDALQRKLQSIETSLGLTIHLRELSEDELKPAAPPANPYLISVYGADKPGIVAGITRELANLGINISDVQTTSTQSETSDVFVMILEVSAPDNINADKLSSMLLQKGKSLGVDISVQPIEIMEL